MIPPNPLLGSAFHALGACFAAVCYTPQKKVVGWSWQSYWLVQAAFCWLLLPLLGAWLTIPELGAVLCEAPREAMAASFLLGAIYGVGGTAFGMSIRHIGFSLTYAIAIGLSTVLGTLLPPLVKGTLGETLTKPGAQWIVAGILIGIVGIACTGAAGRMKERDLSYKFTSWAIHMIMLILFSIVVGVVLREWHSSRRATKLAVGAAFLVLVAAVWSLTYGNHLADLAK